MISAADRIALLSGGVLEQIPATTSPVSGTPTELDTELRQTVYELIDELGKTAMLVAPDLTYDPQTGKKTEAEESQISLKMIPPYPYEEKFINGDTIRMGDMRTGIAAIDSNGDSISFVPEAGYELRFDEDVWSILAVLPIYSGQLPCLYMMQLRK